MAHADVTLAYARRAGEYAAALGSIAATHPSDRALIETWASEAPGPLLDAGCGPGHWTAFLRARGYDARGIDAVPEFLELAAECFPGTPVALGDLDRLDAPEDTFGGVLAWYSTIHHGPERIGVPLAEFARVLRPGGRLLLGYFEGPETAPFAHAITRAHRYAEADLRRAVERAGFEVLEAHRRSGREHRPHGALLCEVPAAA